MFSSLILTTSVLQKLPMGSQGIRTENCNIPYSYSNLLLTLCRCVSVWLVINLDRLRKYMGKLFWNCWPTLSAVFKEIQFVSCCLNVHIVFVVRNMTEAYYASAFSSSGWHYMTVCSLLVLSSQGLSQPSSSYSSMVCLPSNICMDLRLHHPSHRLPVSSV